MLGEYASFSLRSLRHRQLRTWLTVIGIIIGIASIIALISISQGLENAIVEQFEKMGSNRVFLMPKGVASGNIQEGLTIRDVERLESMPEIEWVNPYILASGDVGFRKGSRFVQQIVGIDTEGLGSRWADMDLGFEEGRLPERKQTGIAVIGYKLAKKGFDREIRLKNKITVQGKDFEVVGIVEELGNEDDDTSVWLETEDFREVFNKPDEVSMVEMKLKGGIEPGVAAGRIAERLKRARGNENFEVMTPEQILEQVGELLNIIRLVLGGIAGISLVVGGVGIMNSMYTSVLQRRKEIGIMKSVGATNKDVMMIFLVEAGMIGGAGGIVGVLLGMGIAFITEYAAVQAGFMLLSIRVSWALLAFGVLFALAVGAASGVLPAMQASKLRPAEALKG